MLNHTLEPAVYKPPKISRRRNNAFKIVLIQTDTIMLIRVTDATKWMENGIKNAKNK